MGMEIDFLPVGTNSKSGDAIALRYGNLRGTRDEQVVVVIDGGFKDTGAAVVAHVREHYGTAHVDIVISTHPDQDHISGLSVVLESLTVGELWMHCPWDHEGRVAGSMFTRSGSGRVVLSKAMPEGMGDLERSLQGAGDLYDLAQSKGIPVFEPFAGRTSPDGALMVLGPSQDYYEELLAQIESGAEQKSSLMRFAEDTFELLKEAVQRIAESFHIETLDDSGEVSPQNSSSTVVLFRQDAYQALFTGDAGIEALTHVADFADGMGIDLRDCTFVQVPHHGSKRNVGPTILDRIIGPRLASDEQLKSAFVSVAVAGAPKHPAKKVTNAFRRRGAFVHSTKGMAKRHHKDAPQRPGWGPSEPLPLYVEVEE